MLATTMQKSEEMNKYIISYRTTGHEFIIAGSERTAKKRFTKKFKIRESEIIKIQEVKDPDRKVNKP
jgi:hypothetical protein